MKRAKILITACFVSCPYCDHAFEGPGANGGDLGRLGWTDQDLAEAPDELQCPACRRRVLFPKRVRK